MWEDKVPQEVWVADVSITLNLILCRQLLKLQWCHLNLEVLQNALVRNETALTTFQNNSNCVFWPLNRQNIQSSHSVFIHIHSLYESSVACSSSPKRVPTSISPSLSGSASRHLLWMIFQQLWIWQPTFLITASPFSEDADFAPAEYGRLVCLGTSAI